MKDLKKITRRLKLSGKIQTNETEQAVAKTIL